MERKQVLLAIHSPDRSRMLAYRLRRIGDFEISEIRDGAEVVAAVEEAPPDLIFMDLKLPGLTGWQVMQRIRALGQGRHIPIVALTGCCALASDHQAALDAGFDDYYAKQVIDESQIREKVDRLLGASQSQPT